jgi:hypothetical protein
MDSGFCKRFQARRAELRGVEEGRRPPVRGGGLADDEADLEVRSGQGTSGEQAEDGREAARPISRVGWRTVVSGGVV